jgi:hypothetical protein
MSDWLMKVIRAEADRLIELARDDPELKADLRALAEKILSETATQLDATETTVEPDATEAEEPRLQLTLGQATAPRPASGPGRPEGQPRRNAARAELEALAARCRAKAEAALSGPRSETHDDGSPDTAAAPSPVDTALAAWLASLIDGFYWSSQQSAPSLTLDSMLLEVGGCFETVAAALDLAGRTALGSGAFERALGLVAEAQSALRQALRRVGVHEDDDQRDVFEWLRDTAGRHHVYLHRHMRADDLADPTAWESLLGRIEEAATATTARRETPATEHLEEGGRQEATKAAEVAEVARLLAGKSLVLIGGIRRRDAEESLRKAFALDSMVWIETREHESYEGFEAPIARPEVVLVLLAIRWSSHGFGEVKHLCERHGKPLVRLPGGYGPNQVAAQILAQCGHRLEAPRPA